MAGRGSIKGRTRKRHFVMCKINRSGLLPVCCSVYASVLTMALSCHTTPPNRLHRHARDGKRRQREYLAYWVCPQQAQQLSGLPARVPTHSQHPRAAAARIATSAAPSQPRQQCMQALLAVQGTPCPMCPPSPRTPAPANSVLPMRPHPNAPTRAHPFLSVFVSAHPHRL
jgi:hypothetical protein